MLRFLSSYRRVLRVGWKVELGDRLQSIASRYEAVDVQVVASDDSSVGWFGFSVEHTAGGEHRIEQSEIARLLRGGQNKLSLPGGKMALVDVEAMGIGRKLWRYAPAEFAGLPKALVIRVGDDARTK